MAPLLEDPRFRQTWNQISQNAESATETAAAGIWTFQHTYINPCFSSIASGLGQCVGPCFPDREERARRLRERGRTRGRAELSFDFYDDWDENNEVVGGGLLGGWGNDELDRLLAGSGSHSGGSDVIGNSPRRKRGMSYGTRGARRKSLEPDPTVIPRTSALGFLERFPWRLGGQLRYKPSAADLQEHPGALRADLREEEEGEPLIADEHSDDQTDRVQRPRSSTTSSGETSDSFRSRGDIFPSDGEDDAVPLGDEFAMVLERRSGSGVDDRSSGMGRSSKGKRPSGSRTLSRTLSRTTQSSQSRTSLGGHRASSAASLPHIRTPNPDPPTPDMVEARSLTDLQQEEERIRMEEDGEVERKREAAVRLAVERGLHVSESPESVPSAIPGVPVAAADIPAAPTEAAAPALPNLQHAEPSDETTAIPGSEDTRTAASPENESRGSFVPARLPNFG